MWKQIVALLFVALPAWAQRSENTLSLTVEESHRLMKRENQTLKIAKEQVGIAHLFRRYKTAQ